MAAVRRAKSQPPTSVKYTMTNGQKFTVSSWPSRLGGRGFYGL